MSIEQHDGSTFLHHEPCEHCGSKDNAARFSDGHLYCFGCQTYTPAEGDALETATQPKPTNTNLLEGTLRAIPARGLTEEDCRKFGYLIGNKANGEQVQIATYRDIHGKPVAQKLRGRDKSFQIVGETRNPGLFGQHLWSKGKKLCITEGEIDAISLSKMFGHKYACVSLPNGAQSAVKAIRDNFDYINAFDEIILCFDMDEAGRKAALAVAEILPVGKAKIANLPAKDANEALINGKTAELIQSIYQATEFRPDGIKAAGDYREVIAVDEAASSITWPYSMLNEILRGIRREELITIAAGSGLGKTTFCKEIVHHLLMSGQKVGIIALEESNKRTLLGLTGIHMSKNLLVDRTLATDEEIEDAFDDLFGDRTCYLLDHFGSSDVDVICQRIRFFVTSLGISHVLLDHISIMVSANEGDERRMLDAACTKLRSLCSELGCTIIMVSHLSRPSGRGHEDGASVSLSQLRGSHAIAQLSDACIGLQPDPDDPDSDIRHIRILKNRYTGQTGPAGTLVYNRETGRLLEEDLAHLIPDNDEEGEALDETA